MKRVAAAADGDGDGDDRSDGHGGHGVPPIDEEDTDVNIPRRVASVALRHYSDVIPSSGGKPQVGREWTVYAAVVAVEASSSSDDDDDGDCCWVVSCATGSKCRAVGGGGEYAGGSGGLMLHDSHAEVLARRGLILRLWDEVESELRTMCKQVERGISLNGHNECCDGDGGCAVEASVGDNDGMDEHRHRRGEQSEAATGKEQEARRVRRRRLLIRRRKEDDDHGGNDSHVDNHLQKDDSATVPTFEMRPDVSLHLYVSDSPCGDASIYGLIPEFIPAKGGSCGRLDGASDLVEEAPPPPHGDEGPSSSNFTGAKLIVSERTGVTADHVDVGQTLSCSSRVRDRPVDTIDKEDPPQSNATSSSRTSAAVVVAREHRQLVGKLRTKAGRSNLPDHMRSTSMSCSDKLVRWQIWGWQGSLLSRYVPRPVTVSSICVGVDRRGAVADDAGGTSAAEKVATSTGSAQLEALRRAVPGRIGSVLSSLRDHFKAASSTTSRACLKFIEGRLPTTAETAVPSVHVVPETFPQGKSATDALVTSAEAEASPPQRLGDKRRKLDGGADHGGAAITRYSPCGLSINWRDTSEVHVGGGESPQARRRLRRKRGRGGEGGDVLVEVTVGATGLRRGKKPKTVEDVERSRSRLCRRSFLDRALRCASLLTRTPASGEAGDVDHDGNGGGGGSDDVGTIPSWTSYRFVAVGSSAGENGVDRVGGGDADAHAAGRIASSEEGERRWSYRAIKGASTPPFHRETLDVALREAGHPLAGWLRCFDDDDFAIVESCDGSGRYDAQGETKD